MMQNVHLRNFYAVVKEIDVNAHINQSSFLLSHYHKRYLLKHPEHNEYDTIPDPPPIWQMRYGFTWGTPYVIVGSEGSDLFLLDDNHDIRPLYYGQIKLIFKESISPKGGEG